MNDRNAVAKAMAKGLGYVDKKNIFISHSKGDRISFVIEVN
jgi:hypothetical protein